MKKAEMGDTAWKQKDAKRKQKARQGNIEAARMRKGQGWRIKRCSQQCTDTPPKLLPLCCTIQSEAYAALVASGLPACPRK